MTDDQGRQAAADDMLALAVGGAPPTAGEQLDGIMRDLDATTKAWAAAGYGFDTPEAEAREAVFTRLRLWNADRGVPTACDGCGDRLPSVSRCVSPSGEHTPRPLRPGTS